MKGDWIESQDRSAAVVHRSDGFLESSRGSWRLCAELAITVDIDRLNRPTLIHVVNASNKGGGLRSLLADANLGGLGCNTWSTNINVIAARSQTDPGTAANGDVIIASIV